MAVGSRRAAAAGSITASTLASTSTHWGSWQVICSMAGSTAAALARDRSRLKPFSSRCGGLVPLLLAE